MRSLALPLAILGQLAINVALVVKLTSHDGALTTMRAEHPASLPTQWLHAEGNDAELMLHLDGRFQELREELHSIRTSASFANQQTVFEWAAPPGDATGQAEIQRVEKEARDALAHAITARSLTADSARTLLTNIDGLPGPQRAELMQALVQAVNRQELRLDGPPF
jgi:hypothetical protein